MKKTKKLLGIALIFVFAVIYSACDNPADKLPEVDITRDNTGNQGEDSGRLTADTTDIRKISQELFGDVIIDSQEFLFNLDESPDFIYVDFTNYGYAVFAAESLELLEFAAQGSLPYQNTRGRRYYNGPKGYYTKINEQFVNEVTNESYVISASEARAYSQAVRQTFSVGERELKVEPEENNEELIVRATVLSGKNNPPIDRTNYIQGSSVFEPTYINNSNYFLANPMHGWNQHGTCGSVAAQLLLSYNNYYNDRRIIAPQHLNGGWNNVTGNNNINDPLNYTIPSHNPNACENPMFMTHETTGSNNVFYNALIALIEPSLNGTYDTDVRDGIRKHLNNRNISHSTNSYTINEANVKAQINAHRPVIIGMAKSLGGFNHWVVGYGYGIYKYPTGHPNAGLTRSGFITHFGYDETGIGDAVNIWINSAWCDYYITMQINHTHNYISTGTFFNGQMILRCTTCNLRKTEAYNTFASGTGAPSNPFVITTASHLNNVRDYSNRYFKLGSNINLQNAQWTPIESFNGNFDGNSGNGYTISNLNMIFMSNNSLGYGLFSTNNGTIHNLKVTANINFQNYNGSYIDTVKPVGVIAVRNYGEISNCQVSASGSDPMIYCKTYYTGTVGGIAAFNSGNITFCKNNGIIYSGGDTGGIVGYNTGIITDCENNALVCYTFSDNRISTTHSIGGIAGINYYRVSNVVNKAMILYGGYSQVNDKFLQPRMAHIVGTNDNSVSSASWTSGASVNKGNLISFSWTENGTTYTHNQALYVRNAAVGVQY